MGSRCPLTFLFRRQVLFHANNMGGQMSGGCRFIRTLVLFFMSPGLGFNGNPGKPDFL